MKRFILFFIQLLCAVVLTQICAKTKVVTTEYIYHIPENVSYEQARETAIARARAQAIAEEFGMTVNQVTSVMVENNNGNSSTDFMSLGGSELKGEWIEDLEEPVFEYITDGANLAIKVRIKGRIRESKGSKVMVETKILRNGIMDSHETDQFVSGDDLYISFNSPIGGFIAIYLLDTENNAFCLLPYQSQTDGIFQIKANQKYMFFHPDHHHGVNQADVDRITVDTEADRERNRILIFFSPNKFFKGADSKQSVDLPRVMNQNDFQKWMSAIVKKDMDMTVIERPILITSSK